MTERVSLPYFELARLFWDELFGQSLGPSHTFDDDVVIMQHHSRARAKGSLHTMDAGVASTVMLIVLARALMNRPDLMQRVYDLTVEKELADDREESA